MSLYLPYEMLQPYLDAKLITERAHPDAPWVTIYNYTKYCTYEKAWDDVTLRCRGLILDHEQGLVRGACLKKFFNYNEYLSKGWGIPNERPVIYEKYDGWYGSLYWLDEEPWIATRGSFTSPGAEWATRWFRTYLAGQSGSLWDFWRNPDVTHVFEIISPVTRILVEYGFQGLVHIACLDRQTGENYEPFLTPHEGTIRQAERIYSEDYTTLLDRSQANAEGFVCLFPDSGVRIKMKHAEYVRLSALYTHMSAHTIWSMLRDGKVGPDILPAGMSKEFQNWVRMRMADFCRLFMDLEEGIRRRHAEIMREELSHSWNKDKGKRDKEIGTVIAKDDDAGLLFLYHKMWDALWKELEPSGNDVFRGTGDE